MSADASGPTETRDSGPTTPRAAAALHALAEITLSMSRQLELDPLLARIADVVADLTGARSVVLWQADHGTRQLIRRAASSHASLETPASLSFDEGGAGWVARHQQPLFSADVMADGRAAVPRETRHPDLPGFAAVPLVAGDDLAGVLTLDLARGHRLDETDRALLSAFAGQAAVAIRNSGIVSDVARRSDRLRKVADLAQSVSSSLELEAILSEVTGAVVDLRPGVLCIIRLVDREAGGYRLAGMSGAAVAGRAPVLPFGQGLTHAVAEARRPLLVPNTLEDSRTAGKGWFAERALTVFYGVPIEAAGDLLGVLIVHFPADTLPTSDEREAIDLFAAQAAVAIRNANLFAESEARRRAAEALSDVGRMLSRALDADLVGRQIAESVCTLFAAQSSGVYLLDAETSHLRPLAAFGDMGGLSGESVAVPTGTMVVGLVVQEHRPVTSSHVLQDPKITLTTEQRRRLEQAPPRAVMAVPLLRKDAVIGALFVADREGRVFSPDEVRLAQAFADQATLALENAWLYEQTRQRLRQVDSLREVVEQILVPFSLEERLTLVARKAAELFDADRALVALMNADGDALTIRAGHGLAETELGSTRPLGQGGAGVAAQRGEGVLINDYPSWPARRPETAGVYAIIAYPLLIRGEVIGALSVASTGRERRFARADLERLATLAAPAALAIEHSRLYEQLEQRLRELRDTQAQLVQAGKLSAIGQLVSGVAHELNNPLSVVIGYGQLLLRREPPPSMRGQIEAIVSQADRMAKIVQGLLLFARQRAPERTMVNVADVLAQTAKLRETQLTLLNISLESDYAPELPAVAGDVNQLQQVFLNLLLNAEAAMVEANSGDRIVLRTAMRSDARGRWVLAQVTDNGPGIHPDVLPRIFEPFFTTKPVGAGTGLGLSVSYGIIEQHGGSIEVESRPGATTFTVALPAKPDGPPRRDASTAPIVSSPASRR